MLNNLQVNPVLPMMNILTHKLVLIKMAISAVIVAVLVSRMDVDVIKEVFGAMRFDAWSIALALTLVFVQILALSYRWMILMNISTRQMDYMDSVRITLASLLANYLFITSVGGIIVRVALSVQHGATWVKSATAVTLDRFMTLFSLIVLTVLFMPVLYNLVDHHVFNITLMVIAFFAVAGVALPFFFFKNTTKQFLRNNEKLTNCFDYLRSIYMDRAVMGRIILISLLAQVAYFFVIVVMTSEADVAFSMLHLMAIIPIMTLIASLPIGYGGWGIREGAFVYGMSLIGIPMETAFVISVQVGLLVMFVTVITGVPALFSSKTRSALQVSRSASPK